MIKIEIFPASYGDCFLVRCSNNDNKWTNILIDCGFKSTFENNLKARLDELNTDSESLDLVVVTHIDVDHITGMIAFFSQNGKIDAPKIIPVKEIWHNGFKQMHFKELILSKYTFKEKNLLSYFSMPDNSEADFKDVNAEHDVNLIEAFHRGKYLDIWNKTANHAAISTDNLTSAQFGDVNIVLLTPSDKVLEALDKFSMKEFEDKMSTDFEMKDDGFILEQVWENIIGSSRDFSEKEIKLVSKAGKKLKELLSSKEVSTRELDAQLKKMITDKIREDKSPPNKSSIAFILEFHGLRVLFLGDTVPSLVIDKLSALKACGDDLIFDAIKISHHGSKKNTNQKLLAMIDSENYIISSNGFRFNHPDIETLLWIVSRDRRNNRKRKLIFNYKTENSSLLNDDRLKQYFDYSYEVLEINEQAKAGKKAKFKSYNLVLE